MFNQFLIDIFVKYDILAENFPKQKNPESKPGSRVGGSWIYPDLDPESRFFKNAHL